MSRPNLSVLGLYEYDNSLFDEMKIPQGLNKETVVANILLECAGFETIYPALPFLKIAIGKWSDKELPVWEKLYQTTQYEYDPIYNKDATYEYTDLETRNLKGTASSSTTSSNTETHNLNNQKTNDLTDELTNNLSGSKTDINQVSAYDAASFQNRDKLQSDTTDTGTATTTHTGTENIRDTGTLSNSGSGQGSANTTDTGTVKHDITRREYGNIGVTTTQKMIQEEREIDLFNIYDVIVDSFKKRFCLLVY